MKSLHLLIVALLFFSTLWHGAAMAALSAPSACVAASDGGKQGTKQPEGEDDEEPECD